jgi:hypothetical protein
MTTKNELDLQHLPAQSALGDDGILRYKKKPRFRLLTPDGCKVKEDFRRHAPLTERLADCLIVAEDAIDAAGSLFQGLYALPMAHLGRGADVIELPWSHRYLDGTADVADIERTLDHLGQHRCECRRGGTFSIEGQDRTDQSILQGLAVEVMLAVDNELAAILAGDLEGALWWQAIALENLIECQAQANVVLKSLYH